MTYEPHDLSVTLHRPTRHEPRWTCIMETTLWRHESHGDTASEALRFAASYLALHEGERTAKPRPCYIGDRGCSEAIQHTQGEWSIPTCRNARHHHRRAGA